MLELFKYFIEKNYEIFILIKKISHQIYILIKLFCLKDYKLKKIIKNIIYLF